ncbi:MAG: hypothetical protein R2688_03530 [Fimbriimonadaceae bacterium]
MINNLQNKSRSSGLVAPDLARLVFSLTTFTCTVPFIGTILAWATSGEFLSGSQMLSFSLRVCASVLRLAMALDALNKLPQIGQLVECVKAYLGFIELASAAPKFSPTWT